MRKAKAADCQSSRKKMRPALTPEARENQMISLAVDLAEKQLMEGTASSRRSALSAFQGSLFRYAL